MNDTNGCAIPVSLNSSWDNPKLTIGQACDIRIQQAREQVQKQCIHKARLEALNMLDMPFRDMREMVNGY